jgi:chemotaxis protein methyltransferase CheR
MRGHNAQKLMSHIAEAMATPETFFFRDKKPFDQLKDFILPQILAQNPQKKSLRIWSAACSSGQEAYSIAMIIKEMSKTIGQWNVEIIATDFSNKILEKARKGEYTQFEVQRGLPIQYLMKYFVQNGESWVVSHDIKKMVDFRQSNLLSPMNNMGSFDIIFCRNVLFYFEPETKRKVLENISGTLDKEGYLILGSAESLVGVTKIFKNLDEQRGVYVHDHDGSSKRNF